jgi:putative tryptophan/tyrosine transport system substrate-binding protein
MRFNHLRRREFITLIGGAAAWPLAARAQQPAMPVVGFLGSTSANLRQTQIAAFQQGLKLAGYVEGQNVVIEYRWADGRYERLPAMAADFVQRKVSAIAVIGPPAAMAAKAVSTTIPIVFGIGADPVQLGLVASLRRPGGNLTGVSFLNNALAPKQLEILHELLPKVTTVGLLMNPDAPDAENSTQAVQEAARSLGLRLLVADARGENDIDAAFATLVRAQAGGLVVYSDPIFIVHIERTLTLSARAALPSIYPLRDWPEAGGLISYGADITDAYRQVGVYTGKILAGTKPADLPVQQSTKVALVINLTAAKALGIEIPMSILMQIDEVIE